MTAQDPFDKEFLRRLRHVARERQVKLVLDRARLSDPNYISQLRAQYPLNASERQWQLARDISEATGQPLSLREATNAFHCSRYIDQNLRAFEALAPSREQRAYAYKLAKRYRVSVPREVLLKRSAYEEWVASFQKSEVGEVLDILDMLGWGSRRIENAMERAGLDYADGNWPRSVQFIDWMIERYGSVLHDGEAAFRAKCNEAEQQLRSGCDGFTVADGLGLDDSVLGEIISGLEADGEMIEFG